MSGRTGVDQGCVLSRTGDLYRRNGCYHQDDTLAWAVSAWGAVGSGCPVRTLATQTFIAGLRVDELAAPWVLDGPMNRAAFEAYIETQLAPCLQPGEVVIADNLSLHKSAVGKAFLKALGNWLVFLPPYSLDLNSNEMAFSKLKAHLPRIGLVTVQFRSLSSNICYEGDMEWQRDTQTSFGVMRCGSPRLVD